MAISPISGSDSVAATAGPNEAKFNAAVETAEGGMTPELLDTMVTGAITVGGQMIIMPQANEILKEAMADDE